MAEFDSMLERLGSYQNKETFSFLQDEHNRIVKNILQSRNEEASYLGYIQVQRKVCSPHIGLGYFFYFNFSFSVFCVCIWLMWVKVKKNVELVRGILVITPHRIILLAGRPFHS